MTVDIEARVEMLHSCYAIIQDAGDEGRETFYHHWEEDADATIPMPLIPVFRSEDKATAYLCDKLVPPGKNPSVWGGYRVVQVGEYMDAARSINPLASRIDATDLMYVAG